MSTRAADPGVVEASPGWKSQLAGAGLALVIGIGVVFALGQDDGVTRSPAPAQPMVSDAHRAKAELLQERAEERAPDPGRQQYESYVQFLTQRAREAGTGEVGGD